MPLCPYVYLDTQINIPCIKRIPGNSILNSAEKSGHSESQQLAMSKMHLSLQAGFLKQEPPPPPE